MPATAQRAHQQGVYLAKKFRLENPSPEKNDSRSLLTPLHISKMAKAAPGLELNQVDYGDLDAAVYKAFEYHHLGSLAYVGNAAIFDVQGTSFEVGGWKGVAGTLWAVYLWRSVYFAQSVSFRTRCLLAMDWTKRAMFGRGMFPEPYTAEIPPIDNSRLDECSVSLQL